MAEEKNLKLVSWLIYFFPIFYISGPLLTNIVIGFISIFFLIYLLLKKELLIFKYVNFFFIFCVYLIIISFFADDLHLSLKASIPFFRYGLFVYAIYYLIINDYVDLYKLFKFYLLVSLIICFDIFFEYIFGVNILGFSNGDPERISSFFKDELIVGSYLIKISLITCSIFFLTKKKLYNENLFYFFLVLIWVAIFFTGERTPFILFSLSMLAFTILATNHRKFFLITSVLGFVFIIIFSYSSETLKKRHIDKSLSTLNLIEISKNESAKYFISVDHSAHLLATYKLIKKNLLFGLGPNQYRHHTCKEDFKIYDSPESQFQKEMNLRSCTTHPHSTYPQILLETGIIGLIFIIYFLYLILKDFFHKTSLKKHKLKIPYLIILSNIVIIYLPMIPAGNFFGSYYSSINFFVIGFYFAISKLIEKENER